MVAPSSATPAPRDPELDENGVDLAQIRAMLLARSRGQAWNCARSSAWLAAGIGGLVAAGGVPAAVTGDLVQRAEGRGVKLRSYRLAPGESVACTAAPEDDFVVLRLGVDVEEDESVDVIADFTDLETGTRETRFNEDVVVDRGLGEVVYLQPGAFIRSLPRSRWLVTARARGPKGERRLGPYTFDHTPWEQLAGRQ